MTRRLALFLFFLTSLASSNVLSFDVFMRKIDIGPLCSYEVPRLKNDSELNLPDDPAILESKGYSHTGGIDYTVVYARYVNPANIEGSINGMFANIAANTSAIVSGVRCYESAVPNSTGMQCEGDIKLGKEDRVMVALVVRSRKHPEISCSFSAFYDKKREQYDRERALDLFRSVKVRE
jgi:hypothetical protein